jgi:ADP-heptose:LPS heptosyltransferase
VKILVLRFSSIGDIVLTTPVLRCLRKKFPQAEIHYTTKPDYASILYHNPHVTQVHLLNSSLFTLADALKKERFNYVIDLHNNQRTMLIKWWLGVPSFSFPKLNVEKWMMVNLRINKLPNLHIVDRYFETVKPLGVTNDQEGLAYFTDNSDIHFAQKQVAVFENGFVAWVIGAKQKTKQFPVTKIVDTISLLKNNGIPVVLLGGKEDEDSAQTIMDRLPDAALLNLCGKLTLNQSAAAIQQSKLVVSNDTGLMHIAAAYKKPVICIWGNTIPQFGMYPYKTPHINLQVENLRCRPCSKLGYAACPKNTF